MTESIPFHITGTTCTAEEFLKSLTDESIICLTRTQRIGLSIMLIVEMSLLGLLTIHCTSRIQKFYRHIRRFPLQSTTRQIAKAPLRFFTPLLIYTSIFEAVARATDVEWVHTGDVIYTYGIFQGIRRLGQISITMSALVVASCFIRSWNYKLYIKSLLTVVYPSVYFVLVLPVIIVRLAQFVKISLMTPLLRRSR